MTAVYSIEIEAVEPGALPLGELTSIVNTGELWGAFPIVRLTASTPGVLYDYLTEKWGDEDIAKQATLLDGTSLVDALAAHDIAGEPGAIVVGAHGNDEAVILKDEDEVDGMTIGPCGHRSTAGVLTRLPEGVTENDWLDVPTAQKIAAGRGLPFYIV
jgi:hypothetical protein